MAHLNPKPEDVKDKVPALREEFKKKYADSISKGAYDQRDLDRLDKDDAYARCFLRTLKSKGDVAKGVDIVNDSFLFRKEKAIWDLTDESFPKEIWDREAVYYKGQSKEGFPLLYLRTKESTPKNKEESEILKKFIAYQIEQHHRVSPEQFVVCVFDMDGAGVGNLDRDISKFIITCFSIYFPGYLAYMLNYEMPTLLKAAWAVISAFLSEEQKGKIIAVRKKDITKYIPQEHLWPHMQ